MIERNQRNNCERFVTCSDPCKRNERNTPLGGVTVVRRVDVVPMPPCALGGVAAVPT
jgi:hypothetical protein